MSFRKVLEDFLTVCKTIIEKFIEQNYILTPLVQVDPD